MGGDYGPAVTIAGAEIALTRRPQTRFVFFGDQTAIAARLDAHPRLKAASSIIHCDIAIAMDEKPSQALRRGRWKSGMWRAVEAVKSRRSRLLRVGRQHRRADGNGEILPAHAWPGIERPAIAALWPTLKGESVVLDVGANVGADAGQLVDFALMGAAMASALFDLDRPTVGLLNIGVEEVKGVEEVRAAGQILRDGEIAAIFPITASSKATTSAAARSTSSSPKALPAISRSRPRKARRASSPNICARP